MADSQRKTANLFDPNSTRYHMGKGTNNRIGGVSNGAMFYIEAAPNTNYTIKVYTADSTFVRLYLSNAPIVEGVGESYNVISESETTINPEVTISNTNYTYLWIQVGGTWYTEHGGSSIMLNTGSTAKPYEPYGWVHSLRKQCSATETIQSGDTIYANGQPITAYTLKGNTVQNGTPTPSNPVDVQGVGNKTANLLNQDESTQGDGYIANTILKENDTTATSNSFFVTEYIPVTGGATYYYYTRLYRSSTSYIVFYDSSKNYISEVLHKRVMEDEEFNLTSIAIPSNASYLRMCIDKQSTQNCLYSSVLPSYEPYGFKIPISSGGVTTNIYLGSVQSTRQIKKLVLTGQESWSYSETTIRARAFLNAAVSSISGTSALCNQAQFISDVSYPDIDYFCINSVGSIIFGVEITGSADAFKAYLQAQYAAGTPVTVYYVLATATTGIVNEPLMKIGNYADSISNAVAIPTVDGANTITVDTTVQPSEFSATWTGWHDASVQEYVDGVNLLTDTDFTSSTTDTRTFFNLIFNVQLSGTSITRVQERIEQTGTYTFKLVSTGVGDRVVVKHSGQTRDIVIVSVAMPVQEGDTFIFTANFTGINPTIEGGIVAADMSLTNPKWE